MRNIKKVMLIAAFLLLSLGLYSKQLNHSGLFIIPQPLEVQIYKGYFVLDQKVVIRLGGKRWQGSAEFLKKQLQEKYGLECSLVYKRGGEKSLSLSSGRALYLTLDKTLAEEEYGIRVTPDKTILSASTERGMFYAMQTFFQLLPPVVESSGNSKRVFSIPALKIADKPRFAYRGVMLDVCRHYFTVEEIKKQIAVMGLFKLNKLHLHLSDNQGWRIAIDQYPQLVEQSSIGETYNNALYGPYYYTADDIKELVAFAEKHYVEIIPEIEFPGHSLSALVAFPNLSCTGGPFRSEQLFGYEENVFCVGNESTFDFMKAVLRTVAKLFPSQYIHIGGDECPKGRWQKCAKCQSAIRRLGLKDDAQFSKEERLQSYAITRMNRFITDSLNKKMIGWDEILEGGLPSNAVVMNWRDERWAEIAANGGCDVVMAPMRKGLYMCDAQGKNEVEPPASGLFSYLKDVYAFDPMPKGVGRQNQKHVLGAQVCLWTEWTSNVDKLEYMLYPRGIALAEVVWSFPENKDWTNFLERLDVAQSYLDEMGVGYHIPIPEGVLTTNKVLVGDSTVLKFENSRSMPMVYTLDGTSPSVESPLVCGPLWVREEGVLNIATKNSKGKLSPIRSIRIEKQRNHPAVKRPYSKEVRLRLANGLFRNEKEYDLAAFFKDTVICSLSEYNKTRFDFRKPSLAIFEGDVLVDESGISTFQTNADELWIDGVRLIYNPISSRFYAQKTEMALEKGVHIFKLVFSNRLKEGFASSWYDIDFHYKLPSGRLVVWR